MTGLVLLALTYVGASIPFGVVVTTLYGGDTDIRGAGSGNIGATNVARVYDWRLATPVLALDLCKGFVPVLMAQLLWPDLGLWWAALVALVAFAGHCFSFFLEFRGGKGVATGAGAMLAVTPFPTLAAAAVWVSILALTGRSSVAALTATLSLAGFAWWLQPDVLPVVVALGAGVVFTHVANVRRLVRGEESQVIRPVRWGASATDGPSATELLEQGPAGNAVQPPQWRERIADPLTEPNP
jgi:acyl phosphate:glycerol-3-phosphate acyltransferase